jgi:hypothetical protein
MQIERKRALLRELAALPPDLRPWRLLLFQKSWRGIRLSSGMRAWVSEQLFEAQASGALPDIGMLPIQ